MGESRLRSFAVRIVAVSMIVLLVGPGPLEALARAQASRRALRSAIAHLGQGRNDDSEPPPSASAREPRPKSGRTSGTGAPVATAVLPIPLRPATAEWLGPAQALGDPWVLFDGRGSTSLHAVTSEPVRIGVTLDAPIELSAVTLLGPADGTLTVFAQDEGASLRPIDSLTDVPVRAKPGEWKRLQVREGERVQRLVVQWMPSSPVGPSEIGLWGLGLASRETTDPEIADRILAGAALGGATARATPEEAHVARVALGPGTPASPDRPAVFHATFSADPRSLSRAFLVYELTGVGHFTEAVRQINGLSVRGGARVPTAADEHPWSEGGLQVEEISPDWLHMGDNEIRFLPLRAAGAPEYDVRNVRIVGTAHGAVVEARLADALDGARLIEHRVSLGEPSQPHDVVFEVLEPSDGHLAIRTIGATRQSPVRVNLHGLTAGWHRIDVGQLPAGDTIGVTLESPARARGHREGALSVVSEVAITASALAREADDERIVVGYPLHGECVDHKAELRGFVRVTDLAEDIAGLRANGRVRDDALSRDGSFSLTVPEPEIAVGQGWDVALEAQLSGGAILRRSVHVEPCLDRPSRDESKVEDEGAPFGQVVRAGESTTIAFAGTRLEIPAGAIEKDVRITVRPLVRDQVPKMDPRMANASRDKRGFRFGPHGLTFKKPVKITLPYDASALAPGMREHDILSFYYDTTEKKWQRIGRYGVAEGGALTSLTEHFTDFVNATIAMPDEPGPQSFNPNQMNGIKLASPSAGIDLIEPPVANSSGSARLSYPIEVPPGRNGIEPKLALTYDSERKNGWLGVGWDLPVSAIEIDTRFGVPKYDGSDHYVLDGQELVQSSPMSDSFERRVEGRFDKVQRNQDGNACFHSWTVTDKQGTVYTYGDDPFNNAGPTRAVLADPIPQPLTGDPYCRAFRWGLSSVKDTFGNVMQVGYITDNDSLPGSSEKFVELYPHQINYTSYQVNFELDDLLSGHVRPDVMSTGRPGFLERTRHRLDHIDVFFENRIVRRYQLAYLMPDSHNLFNDVAHFHKSLLASVALQGLDAATQLDQHTFDYSGAPLFGVFGQTGIQGFTELARQSTLQWGSVQTAPNVLRGDDALTRDDDEMGSGGVTLGVGIGNFSLTGSVSGNGGDQTQHLSLFDMNGDGLPDSVDDNGNGSLNFLRPALSFTAPAAFGHLQYVPVSGISTLGHMNRSGWSTSGNISLFGNASVAYANTSTDEDAILTDINGDGFVDIATTDGHTLSWLQNNGHNQFVPGAAGTSLLEGDTTFLDPDLVSQTSASLHRVDPIVRWVAPFSGQIQITGAVQKLQMGGNGVDVAIYQGHINRNDNSVVLLWDHTFGPNDFSSCVPSTGGSCSPDLWGAQPQSCGCGASGLPVNVMAGDQIYTISAPHHDNTAPPSQLPLEAQDNQLFWTPTITYNPSSLSFPSNQPPDPTSVREPYGSPAYQFSQFDDFRLAGQPRVPWVALLKGTVHIDASVIKQTTSDDTTLTIEKFSGSSVPLSGPRQKLGSTTTVCTVDLKAMDTGTFSVCAGSSADVQVNVGDELFFTIAADTPIDPGRLAWFPTVTYACAQRGEMPSCGAVSCTTSAQGRTSCTLTDDPEQEATIAQTVISQSGKVFYNSPALMPRLPPQAFVAPLSQGPMAVRLTGQVGVPPGLSLGPALVLVQGVNTLYCKARIDPCALGQTCSGVTIGAPGNVCTDPITLQPGDEIMLTVFFPEGGDFPDPCIGNSAVTCPYQLGNFGVNGGQPINTNVWVHDTVYENAPGGTLVEPMQSGGFHGWFFGFYNGDSLPFQKNQIAFPLGTNPTFNFGMPVVQGPGTLFGAPAWLGPGSSYVAAKYQNPTRAGFATAASAAGVVPSLRHATTWDLDLGLSDPMGTGASFALGRTSTDKDFVDFNGDRCADSIAADGTVQLGNCQGDFGVTLSAPGIASLPALRRVNHATARTGIGAQLLNVVDGTGRLQKKVATGFTIGTDYGQSTTEVDWIDVNGDGLPDAVSRDASGPPTDFMVRLNYGNRLGSPVPWAAGGWMKDVVVANSASPAAALRTVLPLIPNSHVGVNGIRTQDSASNTLNAGVQGQYGIVSGGAGAGYTFNVTRTLVDLVDINGDGLPDQVMRVPGEKDSNGNGALRVRLNLGDSFDTNEVLWSLPAWDQGVDSGLDFAQYAFLDGANDAIEYRRSKTFTASVNVQVCYIVCFGASGSYESGSGWAHTTLEDVDGDGLPDQVFKRRDNAIVYAKLNQAGGANLLKEVHRPLGGDIRLDYTREGNLVLPNASPTPPVDEPINKYVLSTVGVDDGRGNSYLRTIRYTPTGFYDRVEREDYGFAQVTTEREDSSTLEVDYINHDFYRQGLALETVTRNAAGNVFTTQSFDYALPPLQPAPPPFTVAFFPAENTRTTNYFEGLGGPAPGALVVGTTQTQLFDPVGNLTDMIDHGDQSLGNVVCYHITYDPSLAPNYIFKPSEITAITGFLTPTNTVACNGPLLRDRTASYDARGALTTLTNLVDGGTDPAGNPYSGKPATNLTWSFQFDPFGNLQHVTDPTGYQVTYDYDAIAHTYRTRIIDSFGYVSISSPNYAFGTVASETDINGQITVYNPDEFGRLQSVLAPAELLSGDHTIAFGYSEQGAAVSSLAPGVTVTNPFPAYATSSHNDVQHPGDPIVTSTFVDGLDRVIQTKKDIDRDTGTGTAPQAGMSVSGAILFDVRGRVQQQGQPVFDPSTDPTKFATVAMRNPTILGYDVLDRTTSVQRPDGALTTMTYGIDAPPNNIIARLSTTVRDANVNASVGYGTVRETLRGVHGQVLGVKESNRLDGVTPSTLLTTYQYDPLDELVFAFDTKGNVTSAIYDTVGRLVSLGSPDMGLTTYSYATTGNLGAKQTAQLRARKERITYQYDFNRLEKITYPDPDSLPVMYTYGDAAETGDANFNRAGRVKTEQSEAGIKSYEYDALGNVAHETWSLNHVGKAPGQDAESDTMGYEYDSFGRLLQLVFPGTDAEVVRYGYDHGGNVTSAVGTTNRGAVSKYLMLMGYDEFEQRVRMVAGNGVQTTYAYDPLTRRLNYATTRPSIRGLAALWKSARSQRTSPTTIYTNSRPPTASSKTNRSIVSTTAFRSITTPSATSCKRRRRAACRR